MDYRVMHIPIRPDRRPGVKAKMTSITIHNTANPRSTAINERNWLVNPSNKRIASWHIAVDDNIAVEAIPLDEVAYHAGTTAGNQTSIGIEVCESGDQVKTWNNAVKLVAKMLHDRGWTTERVRTHKSWSGKNCPRLILPRWREFILDISKEMVGMEKASTWAIQAQKWVVKEKLSDGKRPRDSVTREEMWVMLNRLYNLLSK